MGVGGSWGGPSKVQALWVKVRGPASRKEGPRSAPLRVSGVKAPWQVTSSGFGRSGLASSPRASSLPRRSVRAHQPLLTRRKA